MPHSRAITSCLVALLIVLHLPLIARSDLLSSPILDSVCKGVECGKGTCKPSQNSTSLYECECDPGWKQTRSKHDDALKFLPCIVPNCTLNYSCMSAPAAVPANASSDKESIFDPCFGTDCGRGTCNKRSRFTHRCVCEPSYYNLLNNSAFPCIEDCALGMDCSKLGISLSNKSAPPPPALADNGSSTLRQNFHMFIIFLISLSTVVQWK